MGGDAEEPLPVGITLADYTSHTVTLNAKFLLPIWRFHPYLYLGVGAQYCDLDARPRHFFRLQR